MSIPFLDDEVDYFRLRGEQQLYLRGRICKEYLHAVVTVMQEASLGRPLLSLIALENPATSSLPSECLIYMSSIFWGYLVYD